MQITWAEPAASDRFQQMNYIHSDKTLFSVVKRAAYKTLNSIRK